MSDLDKFEWPDSRGIEEQILEEFEFSYVLKKRPFGERDLECPPPIPAEDLLLPYPPDPWEMEEIKALQDRVLEGSPAPFCGDIQVFYTPEEGKETWVIADIVLEGVRFDDKGPGVVFVHSRLVNCDRGITQTDAILTSLRRHTSAVISDLTPKEREILEKRLGV